MKKLPLTLSCLLIALLAAGQQWSEKKIENFSVITNVKGQTLGYSPASSIKILTIDGLAFKDLNKNGSLDPYEDWRLPVDIRAKDLALKMSVHQIAGLMLYSIHQSIPSRPRGFGSGTYNGKPLPESSAVSSDLSDQQKLFITDDDLRHVLITSVESPEVAARWNNNAQGLAEGLGLGIPINTSSDPRHGVDASTEYNAGSGGTISMWPQSLGLAATFDPALVQQFGAIAGKEYRALGITTALSPQIDLGTEPRWNRINGTFGEDPKLSANLARAYVDGFQTSYDAAEIKDGWGYHSVNAMVKHWPGGGPEEGGRDGHFAYGKFAIYPGNNFNTHLVPFLEGAFKLNGKTKMASAVMPYYTISYEQDMKNKENVGNGFSKYIITDLLRQKYGYDGVVCTDWAITRDEGKTPDTFAGKPWGVEAQTEAERHYKVIMAGADQFGGNNVVSPILEAYQIGIKEHGESFMRKRMEMSAVRLLKNLFRTGLFENPYLDPAISKRVVGNAEFMKTGYEAQLKSLILLKNKGKVLPLAKTKTVYVPKRIVPSQTDWFGNKSPERIEYPVNMEVVKKYFNLTDDATKADIAFVFVKSPEGGTGYSKEDKEKGGNGYVPVSLQYGPYVASGGREKSIAAGDPVIDPLVTNRSYRNKEVTTSNASDLKSILDTRAAMKGKPVVVIVDGNKPMIFAEFEKEADAILYGFGVMDQAVMDVLSSVFQPSGLLPVQMPANMEAVEKQLEDVPHDMKVYVDSEGHAYDFAFGLNWSGVINDKRVMTYRKIN